MKSLTWAIAAMGLLGSSHSSFPTDIAESVLHSTRGGFPRHRSPGGRARRKWRIRRAAGRAA